jgi:mycothiol synthase
MTRKSNRYALAPGRLHDAAAVADLRNRYAAHHGGPPVHTASAVEHEWATPGFQVEMDSRLAWSGDRLVGYGHLRDVKEPHVDLFTQLIVDPAIEDDSALEGAFFVWFDERGRQSLDRAPEGARVVLIAGAGASDLAQSARLTRHGFEISRIFSLLRLDFSERPVEPDWPPGIAVRAFRPEQDDVGLVTAYQDAFRDHYGYLEQPLDREVERWRHWMQEPDFDPSLWLNATDASELVGFCCAYAQSHGDKTCGLIDEFGVRPAWRRRGIGRCLLLGTFRTLCDRGLEAVELTVDSENTSDALHLYASAGLETIRQSYTFVKELRPGENLVVS